MKCDKCGKIVGYIDEVETLICDTCAAVDPEKPQLDPRKEWIPRSVRMPAEGDGNSQGRVLWTRENGKSCVASHWFSDVCEEWTHWRTAHEPPPKPEPEWKRVMHEWLTKEGNVDFGQTGAYMAGLRWAKAHPEALKEVE